MNLSIDTLARIADLVSAVAIVVSLIYLAIQLRQNTHTLRSENYGRALDRVSHMQSKMSTDPELIRLFASGLVDPAMLKGAQRVQFTWALYELFGSMEFMFHQSQVGALREDVWQRWSDTLAWWLSWPGVQACWRARPTPFSASFSAHVESLIRAGVPDPQAAARWQEFLAQPGRESAK